MKASDPAIFHELYGKKRPRAVYYRRDFLDYLLMILITAVVIIASYGLRNPLTMVGLVLCSVTLAMFIIRHGVAFGVPVILRRPREFFHMVMYKLQNLRMLYFIALGLLLLENLLIAATPGLPHQVMWMRTVAFFLFYLHLISITLYRTAILVDHLIKKELVREVLAQTPWKRAAKPGTNITLEIVHAYCTGLLTHIVLIAPWYLVIMFSRFSLVFLPIACLLNIAVHLKWLKVYNAWFYRDHWLGHNSEFEFIYLHGTHHDAIPSGLIAVAENGFLEGFMRSTIAKPNTFYNPLIAFAIYTSEIKKDIDLHQYIPGVFPRFERKILEIVQHSTHHYGPLAPYGLAVKLDQPTVTEDVRKRFRLFPNEITNSIKLDEELTDFKWDNPTFRRTLALYDKYQN